MRVLSATRLGLYAWRAAPEGRDAFAALGRISAVHPDGYGYSRFCELYTRWEGKLSPVMRRRHPAGERLFVDYAGATMDVVCPQTGEVRTAQLFVATLGASSYTYVEASWTQSLPDWISSHVRAFDFFGGGPAQVVSDNLKARCDQGLFL